MLCAARVVGLGSVTAPAFLKRRGITRANSRCRCFRAGCGAWTRPLGLQPVIAQDGGRRRIESHVASIRTSGDVKPVIRVVLFALLALTGGCGHDAFMPAFDWDAPTEPSPAPSGLPE